MERRRFPSMTVVKINSIFLLKIFHRRNDHSYESLDLQPQHLRKIFVGGLSEETEESHLSAYFRKFGPIEDCTVIRGRRKGNSRRFAFVLFKREMSANAALSRPTHSVDGQQVTVSKVKVKEGRVFMRGVDKKFNPLCFKKFCGLFGVNVVSINHPERVVDGKKTNHCTITFQDRTDIPMLHDIKLFHYFGRRPFVRVLQASLTPIAEQENIVCACGKRQCEGADSEEEPAAKILKGADGEPQFRATGSGKTLVSVCTQTEEF